LKQKYILETYNQILKVIKNPKLVFENDFVAFLENCCDESYLIYRGNFVKQNDNFIYIKACRKIFKFFFDEILYIEGLKDYAITHTNTYKIATAMNLKTIFDKLSKTKFARNSKSYIANVNHILSFDVYYVYMKNNVELQWELFLKTIFLEILLTESF
jgi:DNA-binding LytR/AlgR family response regulator